MVLSPPGVKVKRMELSFSLEKVRELATLGEIQLSRHAVLRCMKRRLTLEQICSAIYSGEVIDEEPDAYPNPTMTILGKAKGHEEIKLVCTVVEGIVRIITVAPPRFGSRGEPQ